MFSYNKLLLPSFKYFLETQQQTVGVSAFSMQNYGKRAFTFRFQNNAWN